MMDRVSQFAVAPVCLAWIASFSNLTAETLLLPCAADTTLFENNPVHNLGADPAVAAGTTAHGLKARTLLRFDLSKIPAGSLINSAAVDLTVVKASSFAAVDSTFELDRVLVSWGEGDKTGSTGSPASPGEATWQARLSPDTLWSTPGGNAATDYSNSSSAVLPVSKPGAYRFEATPALAADVQFWLDHPEANFGWLLRSQKEDVPGTARRIGSREDPANAPALRVEYSAALPPLTVTGMILGTNTVTIVWTGGQPPYQLQQKQSLAQTNWTDVSGAIMTNSTSIPIQGSQSFFRVMEAQSNAAPAGLGTRSGP